MNKSTKKAGKWSHARQVEAAADYLQEEGLDYLFDIDHGFTREGMPGCCSTMVLHGFPSDGGIRRAIATIVETVNEREEEDALEDEITNTITPAAAEEALDEAIKDWLIDEEDRLMLLTLSSRQLVMQRLAYAAGFRRKVEYEGEDGQVRLYARVQA